ncbi:hypothetical protein [Isoptericola chiayiensis]|nr:hypothetical protein [Isoptericola chiayiensis]NOW02096.1 hypothetical protein [Isoptericola chiayiensis]
MTQQHSGVRELPARSGTKLGVYAVLGIVGVLAVLFLWSQRSQAPGPTDDGATAPSSAPTAPVVQVEDGSTVPSGHDALLASGMRVTAPSVQATSSTATVDYAVYPADGAGDGVVTIPSAHLVLVLDGVELAPAREDEAERRLRGGPAGFFAGFDVDGLEAGGTVDVGVTTRDGTSFEFVDVPVEDPVSGRVRGL